MRPRSTLSTIAVLSFLCCVLTYGQQQDELIQVDPKTGEVIPFDRAKAERKEAERKTKRKQFRDQLIEELKQATHFEMPPPGFNAESTEAAYISAFFFAEHYTVCRLGNTGHELYIDKPSAWENTSFCNSDSIKELKFGSTTSPGVGWVFAKSQVGYGNFHFSYEIKDDKPVLTEIRMYVRGIRFVKKENTWVRKPLTREIAQKQEKAADALKSQHAE